MLGPDDLAQLRDLGISEEEVHRQLRIFAHPPPSIEIARPCRIGDGIRVLGPDETALAQRRYGEACGLGRLTKFVPASGAASRMFQALLAMRTAGAGLHRAEVQRWSASGDGNARELLIFIEGLERFAFFPDLQAAMGRQGLDIGALATAGDFAPILEYLLSPSGLDYAARPKGLLKFHRYPDGNRTPFEEHLVEAAAWVRDANGVSRVHVTVSPEHVDAFRALFEQIRARYERRYTTRFDVAFSVQKPATDTLAVDLENRPWRTADGRLLFRPGGHGALIENLNDLQADLVYIQNVDNVVPDHLRPDTLAWKKLLVGHLVEIQGAVFDFLSVLDADRTADLALVERAFRFITEVLGAAPPAGLLAEPAGEQRAFLLKQLDRPIRVCGVVRNTGEPGGGPFWVRGRDGVLTRQIVEGAQVDPDSPEQRALFASATHFNPVMLVCGVRNWRRQPFDLLRFVDADAVFIARKSKDGRELKALERPGLWNGAMAGWNTIFVEVPEITFAPVKTVNDLLRREHQPASL